jgi:hypothetical protein
MSKPILVDLDMGSAARLTNLPDPSSAQHAATKAYVDSAIEGLNWKDSVRVASTATINLAAPGATIDGITMVANDRFLAKDQTTASANGIYIWNGAATPATRAADMNSAAEVEQAITAVEEGTSAGASFRQTAVNVTLDTTSLAWTSFGTSAAAASETLAGIAELATQAETDAGTDDLRMVTPLKLKTSKLFNKSASATIGDGSATSFNLDHNFNTRDVVVSVYKNSGNYDEVIADVTRPTVNRVTVAFAAAPAASAYRVVVQGTQV